MVFQALFVGVGVGVCVRLLCERSTCEHLFYMLNTDFSLKGLLPICGCQESSKTKAFGSQNVVLRPPASNHLESLPKCRFLGPARDLLC